MKNERPRSSCSETRSFWIASLPTSPAWSAKRPTSWWAASPPFHAGSYGDSCCRLATSAYIASGARSISPGQATAPSSMNTCLKNCTSCSGGERACQVFSLQPYIPRQSVFESEKEAVIRLRLHFDYVPVHETILRSDQDPVECADGRHPARPILPGSKCRYQLSASFTKVRTPTPDAPLAR
jgi:hypothetical protein